MGLEKWPEEMGLSSLISSSVQQYLLLQIWDSIVKQELHKQKKNNGSC